MSTGKNNSIRQALGADPAEFQEFQAKLNSSRTLRAAFLATPHVVMREAGFNVSKAAEALLVTGVREAIARHGTPNAIGIDVNITTRISLESKKASTAKPR